MGVVPAVAGTSMPRSRNRSFCRSMFFRASARVGASVPRPHATSAKPAALAHAARARCRRPAAQCPAPTAAWVTTGMTGDYPFGRPRGPGPVQRGHQEHPPQQPVPAVITSHPVIVAQAARVCQAPGLPLPGRCRPAEAGRGRCSGSVPGWSVLAVRKAEPRGSGRSAAGAASCRTAAVAARPRTRPPAAPCSARSATGRSRSARPPARGSRLPGTAGWTTACTRWPISSSGTPNTTMSATAGCRASTSSTSRG